MRMLLILLLVLLALPRGQAAEVASFRQLGFSPGGDFFAFMEYGVQDGSGFPYANVFIIDLERDAFAMPPVRVLIREGTGDARAAVHQALRKAKAALARFHVDPLRTGRELFHAPPTEGTEPAMLAQFVLWPFQLGMAEETFTLRLSAFPLPGGDCPAVATDGTKGFALDVTDPKTGESLSLYADERLPGSRRCVSRYAIDRVIHYRPARGQARTVVIVRYGYYAFEGLDERYLAVPVQLPAPGGK
jgi:predicted secreted protein